MVIGMWQGLIGCELMLRILIEGLARAIEVEGMESAKRKRSRGIVIHWGVEKFAYVPDM